ncbi:WD40 repeat protein [Phaffia rhodozyma]|uniref:WD40 repeat protein n=1 Tax=Phaffia rhodozyma TaxID=264483 RepID=A0A0F7SS55_PHARH|nr:WD40 repeat protein [Phaffia rhodozyma]
MPDSDPSAQHTQAAPLSRKAKKNAQAAGIAYDVTTSATFVAKKDRPLVDPVVSSLKSLTEHYDPAWGLPASDTAVVASTAVSKSAPLFTADSTYFFHSAGKTLRLHSTESLLPLSTLSSKNIQNGHSQRITSTHLNPTNPLQVVTSSYDGTVKFWDYLDATCLRTVVCPGPVTHLVPGTGSSKGGWFAVVLIMPASRKKKSGSDKYERNQNALPYIYELDLSAPSAGVSPKHIRGHKIRPASSILISPSGNFIVVLAAQKALLVPTHSITEKPTKFVSPEDLTCGAFHPADDIFATGDSAGVVRVWYCLPGMADRAQKHGVQFTRVNGMSMETDQQQEPGTNKLASLGIQTQSKTTPTTTLHWHSHPVSSVAFNSSGTTILSTGQEGVLVMWSVLSQEKQFAPRLGGPISAVGIRPPALGREEEYWLSMADGSVKRIAGNGRAGWRVKSTWDSGRAVPSVQTRSTLAINATAVPLAYHPQTDSLILPAAHPSSIQFYSPLGQSSVLELEVAPSNRVSKSTEKEIEPTRVGRVSIGGDWLATSDSLEKDEDEGGIEERHIKCWLWNGNKKTYSLQTVFSAPHSTNVTSLKFSPTPVPSASGEGQASTLLLSSSIDGVARLWREKRIRYKSGKTDASFVPHTLFSHNSLPIHDSAWAPDSSLLALAQGSVVTLWDPVSSTLKGTLGCSEFPKGVSINHVAFVGIGGRYVVGGASKGGLVVWDLIRGEIAWSVQDKRVSQIVPSTSSSSPDKFTVLENGHGQSYRSAAYHVFSALSPTVLTSKGLHEHVRSLVSYPSPAPENSEEEEAEETFAVLSDRFKVLLAGSGAAILKSTATRGPRALLTSGSTTASQPPVGATLFDEIFGPAPSTSSSAPTVPLVREGGRKTYDDLNDLFEAPAQVLPPMGLLFDEVFDGCVIRRTVSDGKQAGADANEFKHGQEEQENDGAMDLDEVVEDLGEADRSELDQVRAIGDQDIESLASLFRDILSSPAPTSSPSTKTKSAPVSTSKVNGNLTSSPSITQKGTPAKAIPTRLNGNGNGKSASSPLNAAVGGTNTPVRAQQGSGKQGKNGTPGSVGGSGKKRKAT